MPCILESQIDSLHSEISGLRALKKHIETSHKPFDKYLLHKPGCKAQAGKIVIERERWEELMLEKKEVEERLEEIERLIEDAELELRELQMIEREEVQASFG
ncbi:uncharacterized protein H6S33_001411 [Morchella sextelata]|uniref:uncharacterized protein n=1 Tax=Morchella sextelata TaxID=1174677 RepID=UPI001D054EEF|nr:uncharacterized protein H6S33_001411 [Morchella sextelata]KAH0609183.1 hypothetical protein H6S33_001411 [Morchella sextelata]